MKSIELKQGEVVVVNGFMIKAISGGTAFQIQRNKDSDKVENHIFAGICDNIICNGNMVVGKVGDLTQGWDGAVEKVKKYIEESKK